MKPSTIIALLTGLLIGGTAVVFFQASLPPPEGSAEEKAELLKSELTKAQSRIAKLEAQIPTKPADLAAAARGGAADILEDLKHGRPVDLDRLYQRLKPALRDLAPVMAHLRMREQKKEFARIAAHMGEAYHLNETQQKALQVWLAERAIADAETFNQVAFGENSRMEDILKAMKLQKPKKGLDDFMERTLTGSEKQRYTADRLVERTTAIENEANNRLQRLHQAVPLDEAQQDKVFAIMARSSPDFDPNTKLGISVGNDMSGIRPGADRESAIMSVLTADQRRQYEAYRQRQRSEAERNATEMGIKLPADWDVFEEW
ncbi:MAG: hypothetical protein IPK32_13040 [Verrucomicrobiaceae bacterium]|nr:hypothetical protein [Verrucomicrobiaceae bacterium]